VRTFILSSFREWIWMKERFTVCPRITDILILRISCSFHVTYFRLHPAYSPHSESLNLLYVTVIRMK
jgi:hypothetical protein